MPSPCASTIASSCSPAAVQQRQDQEALDRWTALQRRPIVPIQYGNNVFDLVAPANMEPNDELAIELSEKDGKFPATPLLDHPRTVFAYTGAERFLPPDPRATILTCC